MPKTMGLLGKKLGMTRIYSQEGAVMPVTVITTGPCVVLQKKTVAKEGYSAIQVGFRAKKDARASKPLAGHCKAAGKGTFYHINEFRVTNPDQYEVGQEINVADVFNVGDLVDITGQSKGRGFQGVMKRHGFRGGPSGHGSNHHRAPGSIGASAWPSRVVKGRRMPGQMGNVKMTKKNVRVIDIMPEDNALVVKGSVPGSEDGVLHIYIK
ncbi:MAG: 50S ribosomal protein L3 [Deltaproteobacteria bacterium CG23_combo_of_CG06-09_8_20_14_all_60_8]|nr:MAG: 50S ribosomal protein L3 [Desulfobacterales bacterium CG2_30_60_27]PIP43973.1 MAG: 50S ribosomal protein L3 [Deltaproteobacteria bacterium CG23_combo_of_CG06-09_8_20_14_all_60_8]